MATLARLVGAVAIVAALGRASHAADDPRTCARDPIATGDVHALARAVGTGDAHARFAAVFELAGRLAVDRAAPVETHVVGDVGEQWIVLPLPITLDAVSALARALGDPDPAVRGCAAQAIELDLLAYPAPVRPAAELAILPELMRTVLAELGPLGARDEHAALGLVLAAGHPDARAECDTRYWDGVLVGVDPSELAGLARRAAARAGDDRSRYPVCALLEGIVHQAAARRLLDPILEATAAETRDRYFPIPSEGGALAALGPVIADGVAADREPRVLDYLLRHGNEVNAIELMARLRQPAVLRRAGAHLLRVIASPNTTPFEAAATALASMPLPELQRAAARRFVAVLAVRAAPIPIQQVAHAVVHLTDPQAQTLMIAPLIAAQADRSLDENVRRPLLVALGAVARSQAAVDVLVALLADPDPRIRGSAAQAIGAIPDDALQDRAVDAVIAAVDDPDLGASVAAVMTLGQLRSSAARAKARPIVTRLPQRLPAIDQRVGVAACALQQLDGHRPAAARCDD